MKTFEELTEEEKDEICKWHFAGKRHPWIQEKFGLKFEENITIQCADWAEIRPWSNILRFEASRLTPVLGSFDEVVDKLAKGYVETRQIREEIVDKIKKIVKEKGPLIVVQR